LISLLKEDINSVFEYTINNYNFQKMLDVRQYFVMISGGEMKISCLDNFAVEVFSIEFNERYPYNAMDICFLPAFL